MHGYGQQERRRECRNNRSPQHRSNIAREPTHQRNSKKRSDKSTNRVERLAKAIGCTALVFGCDIRDQGITWRAANSFSDSIDEPCSENPCNGGR